MVGVGPSCSNDCGRNNWNGNHGVRVGRTAGMAIAERTFKQSGQQSYLISSRLLNLSIINEDNCTIGQMKSAIFTMRSPDLNSFCQHCYEQETSKGRGIF